VRGPDKPMRIKSRGVRFTSTALLLVCASCSDGNLPLEAFSEECKKYLQIVVHNPKAWQIYVRGIREEFDDDRYFIMMPDGFSKEQAEGEVIYGRQPRSYTQIYREKVIYKNTVLAEIVNLRRFNDSAFALSEASCISGNQDLIRELVILSERGSHAAQ
jgi:hypothetical protein